MSICLSVCLLYLCYKVYSCFKARPLIVSVYLSVCLSDCILYLCIRQVPIACLAISLTFRMRSRGWRLGHQELSNAESNHSLSSNGVQLGSNEYGSVTKTNLGKPNRDCIRHENSLKRLKNIYSSQLRSVSFVL